MPLLTTLNRVDLTINGSSTVDTKQIASYSSGTLTVSGGAAPDFAGLATIGAANGGTTLQAQGAGSVLALPAYTTLQGATGYGGFASQCHRRRRGRPQQAHRRRGGAGPVLRRAAPAAPSTSPA